MAIIGPDMGMNREGKLVDYGQPKPEGSWCNEFLHQFSDKPVEYGLDVDAFQRTWANTGTQPNPNPIWGIDPLTYGECYKRPNKKLLLL